MALPNLADWRVESLRITVFGSEPISASGKNWWKAVTETDPEAAINRPQSGEFAESGTFLNGQFELKSAFNRLDFLLIFPFAEMPGAPEPQSVIPLLNEFVHAVVRWASVSQFTPSRVALGAVVYKKVQDIPTGNMLISNYVPNFDFSKNPDITDLFIQINTPYVSDTITGAKINNVTKWGVLGQQVFAIGSSGMPQITSEMVVRSEFDLSTAVDGPPVDIALFEPLTAEMIRSLKDVLESGLDL